ncbi:conserved hypothetical protein [Tenacibaculum maritimum]|uniref:DUF3987 domain-containing protein n=1 Tax=Tenacibaculum maritimum TaxID=107401 RepID=UPI0012E4C283|nr:DUF3987 domain-containing protein [Tenacibaculum maritimum]CAA0143748.1 conserved hypothetical protein [Tenacibaculum maritimum]CAA0144405.1 conserved hypothetical protein [Tenacibaculum maritimum]CAA0205994.1 conserved hypothetical protein [Tenacibaculum maritimum]CAA0248019.1 conserved hypothetical protein [Tenacibaculum maritimum]
MERRLIEKSVYKKLPNTLKSLTDLFDGREKDIVLLSSLGVLSNCIPNVFGIYDGDTIYPHLYVIIIAPPASGKGVMNNSRILIEKIHDKILNDSKIENSVCEQDKKKNKNNTEPCPNLQVKILPANISNAEMYNFLGSSQHGILIMESEADTMSNMLNNDWSNYSDVLRKAFHHEPISISRKIDKVFEDIKEPKLSMVISGTPDQLKPLIKSRENGLFSRFIIYNFDEVSDFKDVFALKTRDNKIVFKTIGEEIFKLYGSLIAIEKPIEFSFTESQQKKFLDRIRPIRNDIINNHSEAFISNLHRHGLVLFRIAMILTMLRNKETMNEQTNIICSNQDFITALYITKTLLRHSQFTFNTIDNGVLSIQDEEILDSLNQQFSRKDAIESGSKKGIPKRTVDDKLAQWQRKKAIRKVKKGTYKKL